MIKPCSTTNSGNMRLALGEVLHSWWLWALQATSHGLFLNSKSKYMVETLKNTQLHGGAKVLIAKKRAVNVSKGGTVCAGLACAFEAFFWKLNPFVLNPLPFNWQYIKSMPDQQVKKPTCSILNLNGSIGSIYLPTSFLDFSRVSIMDWELLGCAYSQRHSPALKAVNLDGKPLKRMV